MYPYRKPQPAFFLPVYILSNILSITFTVPVFTPICTICTTYFIHYKVRQVEGEKEGKDYKERGKNRKEMKDGVPGGRTTL
jgi:hypothetical protein